MALHSNDLIFSHPIASVFFEATGRIALGVYLIAQIMAGFPRKRNILLYLHVAVRVYVNCFFQRT